MWWAAARPWRQLAGHAPSAGPALVKLEDGLKCGHGGATVWAHSLWVRSPFAGNSCGSIAIGSASRVAHAGWNERAINVGRKLASLIEGSCLGIRTSELLCEHGAIVEAKHDAHMATSHALVAGRLTRSLLATLLRAFKL